MYLLFCFGFIIIAYFLLYSFEVYISRKQAIDSYFTIKITFKIFLAVMIIVILSASLGNNDNEKGSTADGFTISYFNIDLNVNQNNVVNVSENIGIDFYESNHHGIYVFIPEWLSYTSHEGKNIKRKSIVSNLKAENEEYSLDTVKNKKRIKIGSPYNYVDTGIKDYIIKFDYDMGEDPFRGYDEFIYHLYGDYWGTEINNATVNITMPSTIKKDEVSFYLDKSRNYNVTEAVDMIVNDNKIYAKFNNEKYQKLKTEKCSNLENCAWPESLKKSLTVSIVLPENYFINTSNNYSNRALIFILITFIIMIIIFILWLVFGKDHKKEVVVSEYIPPRNLSSAEIGYIFGKQNSKKLAISLIVELASKKIIKIDEKNRKIVITNLNKMPKKELVKERKVEIFKLKDIDETYDKSAKLWFNNLFKNEDTALIENDFHDFEKYSELLEENKFIKIKEYPKTTVNNDYYEEEKNVYDSKIDNLNSYEKIIYNLLFISKDEVVLKEHTTFYTAFRDISRKLNDDLKWVINDKKSTTIKSFTFILSTISILISMVSYYFIADLSPKLYDLYYLSFIFSILSLVLTLFMGRKTSEGEKLNVEVMGFKKFLEEVEKDKLEELVNEMPEYFYMILPYTYVLNISKKWIKKFENISMPKIDYGNFDIGSIDSISSNISYPLYNSSSSSSSCGGGCSSCGGGCSSCGGGGSW